MTGREAVAGEEKSSAPARQVEPAAPRTSASTIHEQGGFNSTSAASRDRDASGKLCPEGLRTRHHRNDTWSRAQPVMEVYSPGEYSLMRPKYISTINSKTICGDGPYGRGHGSV